MGKPFEVEVECGAPAPVRFTITEEYLDEQSSIEVRSILARHDVPDKRTRYFHAALEVIRRLIERNATDPVRIFDEPDVWVIPDQSVRWVKLHDPEASSTRSTSIGFRRGPE